MAADAFSLLAAFVVTQLLVDANGSGATEMLALLSALPLWFVGAGLAGLYRPDTASAGVSTVDELPTVVQVLTVSAWLALGLAWALRRARPSLSEPMLWWALAIALVPLGRAAVRAVGRRRGFARERAVIVGGGDVGQVVCRKIVLHPEYGIDLVGVVDDNPRPPRPDVPEMHVLGGVAELARIIREHHVDRLIVAFSQESPRRTIESLRSLRSADVRVDIVPRLFDLVGPGVGVEELEGLAVMRLPSMRSSSIGRLAKRALDLVVASSALILTAPLFAAVALLIKRESPGPVLFRQTRLGFGMREFTNLKFRTMRVDTADAEHREYIRSSMAAAGVPEDNGLFKLSRPEQTTRTGRWLRKTSLDELPQLLNVVRGDMSMVGPRPCIPYETEYFEPHHFERFLVPAGLTGLWQVSARARSTFAEALELDVAYVRGHSLALDLRILLRTPVALLRMSATT